MIDTELRDLVVEYGQMRVAKRGGEQVRGQRFNDFLARLLRVWGVEAFADQRGIGNRDEIDVGFSVGRAYYILEAKWQAKKVDIGPVAKLYLRLKVRPPGTGGVLVSMSGFTPAVREFTEYHPEIILWDRSHIEAMLCGLLDPDQLFHYLFSWTSRRGGSYVPLAVLLASPHAPQLPTWELLGAETTAAPRIRYAAEGVTATPLLAAADLGPSPWTGMARDHDGTLLLTCDAGVLRTDPVSGASRWQSTLRGCFGPVVPDLDGGVFAVCNLAVVRWSAEGLAPAAGVFPARSRLLASPGSDLWMFSTTGPTGPVWQGSHTLTRVAGNVGEEEAFAVDFAGQVKGAAVTGGDALYLVGGYWAGVLDIGPDMVLDDRTWFVAPELGEVGALLAVGEHRMLSAGRDGGGGSTVSVWTTDMRTDENTRLLTLEATNAVALVAAEDEEFYLLIDVWGARSALRPLLLKLTLPCQAG